MSGIYGSGPKGKATKLHAEVVRSIGFCQCCGSGERLQCAHIVTRNRNATRTDLANAFCLCAGCHLVFTHNPFKWVDFVVSKIGRDAYDALERKSLDPSFKAKDAFWLAEVERLQALLKEVAA